NLLLQLVPRSAADRARLIQDFASHTAQLNLAGAEMLVRYEPDNAANQTLLGSSYVDAGRLPEAMACLERALQLDPRSARAHNEMGGALMRANRLTEAVTHFRQAAALQPRDARLQYNLGKALQAAGPQSEAEVGPAFERALALEPGLAEAHDELGVWL